MTTLLSPIFAELGPVSPGIAYDWALKQGVLQPDPSQQALLAELDRIHWELIAEPQTTGLLQRLFKRSQPATIQGLYMCGGVGRGKTLLMDLLYESLAEVPRQRVHFHRFMGQVHHSLRQLGGRSDPLEVVARRLARRIRILCLDEFFVSDIADAMILGELLRHLFARGCVLVTTSNTEPAQLYRDGLQRARFLPAIALLERHCSVIEMAAGQDFRLRALRQAPVYHWPLNDASGQALAACFQRLAGSHGEGSGELEINSRSLNYRQLFEGVIWFDFAELCEGPRAVPDYIEIARSFHTVLLSGVPRFDGVGNDPARRFVFLVDAFYDRNVNLVLSAEVAPTELYLSGRLSAEFERTSSRLIEMQSEDYLARAHQA